jgi:hypothetical protein
MSVSMIENWAIIQGLVQAISESRELDGFDLVDVLVENVETVEGYPNLVKSYLDEANEPRLPVLMPVETVVDYHIEVGVIVECRVRRAGLDRVFVHREYVSVHRPTS